jgi:hypothetical protein
MAERYNARMNLLPAILTIALAWAEPTATDHAAIQGIWRGTGRHERYTLIFSGDVLIGTVGNHPATGNKESGFASRTGKSTSSVVTDCS